MRNIGATLDANLNLEKQVNTVTCAVYYNMRCISKIKLHLTCRKPVPRSSMQQ